VKLDQLGNAHEFHTIPGSNHAFFNDDRLLVFDPNAAEACRGRLTEFLWDELATDRRSA